MVSKIIVFGFGNLKISFNMVLSEVVGVFSITEKLMKAIHDMKNRARED